MRTTTTRRRRRRCPSSARRSSRPDGKGVVVANNLLKLTSRVKRQLPDGSFEFKEYPAEKLKTQKTIADTVRDDKDEHIKEILDE